MKAFHPMPLCKNYGDRPGCLSEADDRYTMDFSDIGEPPIHWCAYCGPEAKLRITARTPLKL